MAKYKLTPYDQINPPAVSIDCELNTNQESVFISYKLQGELSGVNLGKGHPNHARVIKLWEKTCFELFIKNSEDSYIEFNFSPEFEWNCFYFAKKGDALGEYLPMDSLKIDILLSLDVFHLIIEIDKKKFPKVFFKDDKENELKAAISSVIQDSHSVLSYWALSHHDSRPNFHDFRSFTACL